MNRKAVYNLVDEIIGSIANAHGQDLTGRPGIDSRVQLFNGKAFEALLLHKEAIVKSTNPPAVQPPIEKAPAPAPKPVVAKKPAAPANAPADAAEAA